MPKPVPPPLPPGIDPAKLFANLQWAQRWEIFQNVHTPGQNPVTTLMDYAAVPEDLSGKSVLDIGPWNGCFSFECARRGAARVVALGPEDPNVTGFDRLRDCLGLANVVHRSGSVYRMDPNELGTFDIVLFFGVLYHLRYPLLALDQIYEVCTESLFLESYICDQNLMLGPDRQSMPLADVHPLLPQTQVWQFFQHDELNGDNTNWFGPSLCALRGAVESAGFTIGHTSTWGKRAALAARRGPRPIADHNTYERVPVIANSVGLHVPWPPKRPPSSR